MKFFIQKTDHLNSRGRFLTCFILPAVLLSLFLSGGCSDRKKKSPIPKTKGVLLLEIYDSAQKKQYGTALQKIERYKILDPESAVIAELENTIRFNHMTEVMAFYLKQNNFLGALNAVETYEKKYGISKRTIKVKEHLMYFVHLDQYLAQAKEARSAHSLEMALKNLEKINKERKLSPKIVNFLRKERSKLKYLVRYERDMISELLCMESAMLLQSGKQYDRNTAETLCALAKAVNPGYMPLQDLEKRFALEEIIPE